MNGDEQKCIYCNTEIADTKDHVPPKSFFSKPRPADLITVPACLRCNKGTEKDEELFLATFMFGQAGVSAEGKKLWDEKLNRMYEKNVGLKRKIAQFLKHEEISTPAGIYLGKAMTIQPDFVRAEKVNKLPRRKQRGIKR